MEYGLWDEAEKRSITFNNWGKDWNDFFLQSSARLRTREVCDCRRDKQENRCVRGRKQ